MKKIYLVLATILAVGCVHTERNAIHTLEKINASLISNPDSVLTLLEDLNVRQLTPKEQAYYTLLKAKAEDKLGKPITEISLLKESCDYFSENKMLNEEAACYFYLGRYEYVNKRIELALKCYLKANDLISPDDASSLQMKGLISDHLGSANFEHDILDECLSYYNAALNCFQQLSDSANIILSLRNIGRHYMFESSLYNAFYYYGQALNYAVLPHFRSERATILKETSILHRLNDNYDEALSVLKRSIEIETNQNDLSSSFLSLGKIYNHLDMEDEAVTFFESSLSSPQIYTKLAANRALFEYHIMKRNYEKALHYNDSVFYYNEMAHSQSYTNTLLRVHQKNETEKLKKKNLEHQLINKQLAIVILVLLLVASIIISVGAHFHYQYKRKKERELLHIKEKITANLQVISHLETQRETYQTEIEKNNLNRNKKKQIEHENKLLYIKLNELEKNLQERIEENKRLQASAKNYKNTHNCNNLEFQQAFLLKNHIDEILLFRQYPSRQFLRKDENRMLLNQWIDIYYNGFYTTFRTTFSSLTDREVLICNLIKLGLTNATIAEILSIDSRSVSRNKTRIKQKINLKMNDSLTQFIQNYRKID